MTDEVLVKREGGEEKTRKALLRDRWGVILPPKPTVHCVRSVICTRAEYLP